MPKQIKAAVIRRLGGPFEIERLILEDPRDDEVLVRVKASGICHTDAAVRDGFGSTRLPVVLGHEGAGVIEAAGRKARGLNRGDHVIMSFCCCGGCAACKGHHPSRCKDFDRLNFSGARKDGSSKLRDKRGRKVYGSFFGQSSFATYCLTSLRNVIPVDWAEEAALTQLAPFGCGVQTGAGTVLNELVPENGESLVVFGAGAVGLSAVMAGALLGAGPVAAIDIVPERLKLAKRLGAQYVLDASEGDPARRLRKLLGPIDTAVDTTGSSRVIDQALAALGERGRLSLPAISSDSPGDRFKARRPLKTQTIIYSAAGDSDPPLFLPFLLECYRRGRFPVDQFIRTYPLEKINQAIEDSLSGKVVKPVIRL